MVHKKSEYQNQFKLSIANNHQSTYLENLTFRHTRRDREFLHTPICWDVQDEKEGRSSEDEENYPSISKTSKPTGSDEPQYQSLAEILAESSKKNEAFRQKKGKPVEKPDVGRILLAEMKDSVPESEEPASQNINESVEAKKGFKEKRMDTYILPKQKIVDDTEREYDSEDESKLMEEDCKYVTSDFKRPRNSKQSTVGVKSRGSGHKLMKSTGRPKRPDRQGVIPGATRRPQSAVSLSLGKPPFISYGVGDKEPTLAIHRTHNVRSSVDVYSQALKAQRIRESQKKRRQKEKQRAVQIQSANSLLEKLAIVKPRDSQSWQSEYRKQFHGYEPQEYERAMSSRAVISRSTPINAVHRGNCFIVHVD